jgi:hypothetical protein
MCLRPNGILDECELVVTCDRQVGNQMEGRMKRSHRNITPAHEHRKLVGAVEMVAKVKTNLNRRITFGCERE